MTNPQTEARAIAPLTLEGAIWHYMDEKTVAAYGPWITKADHDAALAAKDAELVKANMLACANAQDAADESERAERAEAQLAEANKALEPFARNIELIHPGAQDHDRLCDYGSQFNGTPTVGQARRAREAALRGDAS